MEILILPLDVSNVQEGGGLDMKGFWYTMTMTSAIFIFLILPVAYFYYETEGDALRSRIWHATKMEFFFLIIFSIIIFVSYAVLSKTNVPVEAVDWLADGTGSNYFLSLSSKTLSEGWSVGGDSFTVNISFAVYLIGLIAFIGWWFFIIFVGVGITAIPMDLINEFRNRPRRMTQDQFNVKRNKLLQHVKNLRKDGKYLESVKESVDKGKGVKGWKNKRSFNRDLTKFEARWLIAEKEFVSLEKVTKLSKIEPCLYWLKLFFGILLIILSLVWIIHIFLWVLVKPKGNPVHPFLNNMLEGMQRGHVEFLSTTMLAFLALYLLWATIKGNIKFGLRFFWFTLYPMRPNETFLSSLIFNAFMVNVWAMSLMQYLVENFSMFARWTDAYLIFAIQIRNTWFFKWFYANEIFTWFLIVWIVIAFFYLIFKPVERLSLEDHIKNKDLESNRN
jgi:LMBR1 domain-containing protein 1